MASDGVWEFLDNNAVLKILKPYLETGKEESGITEVISESVANWKKEDVVIDDITIVLAVINPSNSSKSHQSSTIKRTLQMTSPYRSIPSFH